MKYPFSTFLRAQRRTPPPVAKADLTGQTIMMIGCNSGLGFEATKHLCRMNPARVILAARSEARGRQAVQDIKAATGKDVELWLIELTKLDSVLAFADRFEKDGGRLDLLVYNAGVSEWSYSVTVDGYETTIAVNHIAAAVLQLALLPRLVDTAVTHGGRPRIVQVASDIHYWGKYDQEVITSNNTIEKLSDEKYCKKSGKMSDQYAISKLMNVMFIKSLNAHLTPSTPVFICSVNPGFCVSGLRRAIPWPASWIANLFEKLVARSTEVGSRQIVYAAVGLPDTPANRGAFVGLDCEVWEESDYLFTEDGKLVAARLWNETLELASAKSTSIDDTIKKYLTKN